MQAELPEINLRDDLCFGLPSDNAYPIITSDDVLSGKVVDVHGYCLRLKKRCFRFSDFTLLSVKRQYTFRQL